MTGACNKPPLAALIRARFTQRNLTSWRGSTALMRCMLAASAMLASGAAHAAPALPTGGTVASGSATIGAPASGNLTITQSSDRAIVNWKSFSVGQGGTVNFNNGSGATLNRVTGSASSAINGQLNATGSVYLINPNGVVVGKTGVVNVGKNFVASTLNASDAQFNAGGSITLSGNSQATVVNYGKIGSLGGDVALVARTVTNNGTISAPNGSAGLLAGSQVTLNDSALDDGKFSVDVGSSGDSATNSGTIQAADAELRANGGNVYALAGNTNGVIAASGTSSTGGKVFLIAGNGNVTVSGAVTAQNVDAAGGQVMVRGANISVGGTIDASAAASGKAGGRVSVIGTANTSVLGTIDARGKGASGGTIETSGHTLSIGAANVDAGEGGEWLLDPYDLTVDATAASTIDTTLSAGTSVTLKTTASSASGPGNQNAVGNGDIFINSALSWSTAATLTLDAYHSINVVAPITVAGAGGVVLKTNDGGTGGDFSFGLSSAGFAGGIAYTGTPHSGQSLQINGAAYTLLYTGDELYGLNLRDLGTDYALANSVDLGGGGGSLFGAIGVENGNVLGNGFTGIFEGLGHTVSGLQIQENFGNLGLFGYLAGTVRDVAVGGVIGTITAGGDGIGGLVGVNVGTVLNTWSGVTVNGNGNAIGGLVGENQGTITNSFATGAVSGYSAVGGLVGLNFQAPIKNSYAIGTVSGTTMVGGLVGQNAGSINNAYATGAVSAGLNDAGGLVGQNTGGIVVAYATGNVNAPSSTNNGGLVGSDNGGTISNVYAMGAVNGSAHNGGLVGIVAPGALVRFGFSTGTVSGSGFGIGPVIGLAAGGSLIDLFYDSDTNGTAGGSTTAQLSSALPPGFSSSVWSNANNQTTPFLPGAPGPFYIGSDSTHLYQPVTTASQLQAINNNLNGYYALIGNIDASITSSWNSGLGLVPLGTDGAGGALNGGSGFNGVFDGLGYTIDNLSVTLPTNNAIYHDVGLFGVSSGIVRNVGLLNATVSGQQSVGALVGANFGTVYDSFATGSVTGAFSGLNFGGLVGLNEGSISEAYADVAVKVGGAFDVAGLVGLNTGGTISDVYSIGNVNGGVSSSAVGGLIGGGAVSDGFWDWHVSGQSSSSSGTRLTTAQLQGTLPGSFSSSIWGTSLGLYPYLKEFYPNGVQAIEGTAFSDAGVIPLAGARIGLDSAGSFVGVAPSGANGLYYIALPAGTLANNTPIMTYVSGAHSADLTFAVAIGTTPNVNLNAGAIIGTTNALSFSSALSISSGDSNGFAAANSATHIGLTAMGTSFTFDEARNDLATLSLNETGGTLIIGAPVSVTDAFDLNALSAIDIDAALTETGAGSNVLRTGLDTTTVPGQSLTELSFGPGGSLSFGSTNQGATLSINNTAYTLLYSASDIQNINTDALLSGNYALADSIDATGVSGWVPVGLSTGGQAQNGGLGFAGTFEGLGNTISNLTVNAMPTGNAAMFGYTSGTIRDLDLANVTINATGAAGAFATSTSGKLINDDVSSGAIHGGSYVGGLVGQIKAGSVLVNDKSAATIVATGSRVGGLGGWNAAGSTIANSSASGHVSGFDQVGGLIGWNDGSIFNASASGEVTGSDYAAGGLVGYSTAAASLSSVYATGNVDGTAGGEGGLVGYNLGSVSNAYAAGNVGIATTHTVGGLIGNNLGHVSNVYAAGLVTGAATKGALFGANAATGTLSNGYYDALVTGSLAAIGSNANASVHPVALNASTPPTAQASYAGFDFSAIWMIAAAQMPTLRGTP